MYAKKDIAIRKNPCQIAEFTAGLLLSSANWRLYSFYKQELVREAFQALANVFVFEIQHKGNSYEKDSTRMYYFLFKTIQVVK